MVLAAVTSGATSSGATSSWREGEDLRDGSANVAKKAIKNLFYDRWKERWNHLFNCRQTKY